jgi:hypothetical protein
MMTSEIANFAKENAGSSGWETRMQLPQVGRISNIWEAFSGTILARTWAERKQCESKPQLAKLQAEQRQSRASKSPAPDRQQASAPHGALSNRQANT